MGSSASPQKTDRLLAMRRSRRGWYHCRTPSSRRVPRLQVERLPVVGAPDAPLPRLPPGAVAGDLAGRAVGAAGMYKIEVDIELARQRAHRRQNLKRPCPDRLARRTRRLPLALFPIELADDRACIGFRPLGKFDERRSHLHQIALGTEQPCDAAAARRWHLHDGLVRLNRYERLVGDHMIALGDVPGDDLGLPEAFA